MEFLEKVEAQAAKMMEYMQSRAIPLPPPHVASDPMTACSWSTGWLAGAMGGEPTGTQGALYQSAARTGYLDWRAAEGVPDPPDRPQHSARAQPRGNLRTRPEGGGKRRRLHRDHTNWTRQESKRELKAFWRAMRPAKD